MTAKGDLVTKTAGAEGCIHLTKHRHLLQHEMSCALVSATLINSSQTREKIIRCLAQTRTFAFDWRSVLYTESKNKVD